MKETKKKIVVSEENMNITASFKKSYIEKILEFWNKDLKKKFIIIFIIAVVLVGFFANVSYQVNSLEKMPGVSISNSESVNSEVLLIKKSAIDIIKSKLSILGLTAIAGIVPYFYVPVFGLLGYTFTTGMEIGIKLIEYNEGEMLSIFFLLSTILDIICISLVTSVAIYWANMSTKRYLYSSTKNYSFLNLKLQIHDVLKKEDKIEQIKEEIEKRNQKQEKNNVKIKYLEILGILGIAVIIQMLSVFISII